MLGKSRVDIQVCSSLGVVLDENVLACASVAG